jgi:hypothetical protein
MPLPCLARLVSRAIKRNVFIEQAPSAESFCAFKVVCVDGKLGVRTGWRASVFASGHELLPLA